MDEWDCEITSYELDEFAVEETKLRLLLEKPSFAQQWVSIKMTQDNDVLDKKIVYF